MSTNAWIIVAVAAVLLVAVRLILQRRRSPQNSVDSFRRQIDALGPAARRTVVDQVQQTGATRDPDSTDDDPADEGGTRGT